MGLQRKVLRKEEQKIIYRHTSSDDCDFAIHNVWSVGLKLHFTLQYIVALYDIVYLFPVDKITPALH